MIEDTVSARGHLFLRAQKRGATAAGHREKRSKSEAVQISVRFNPADMHLLNERAHLHSMAVSQVIRRIVLGIDKPISR